MEFIMFRRLFPKKPKKKTSKQQKVRRRAVKMLREGKNDRSIVTALKVAPCTVRQWRKKLEQENQKALGRKKGSGRRKQLTRWQIRSLKKVLERDPQDFGYLEDRWTVIDFTDFIICRYQVRFTHSYVRKLMKKWGVFPRRPSHSYVLIKNPKCVKRTFDVRLCK